MKFIQGDYFGMDFTDNPFDGIISDVPYKGAITGKLGEAEFDFDQFMSKAFAETKKDGFLISFINFFGAIDMINAGRNAGWNFHVYQIWMKQASTWIAWSFPLRRCEFLLFFSKGKFKFTFWTGEKLPAYKRSSFGGSLKETQRFQGEFSFPVVKEILGPDDEIKLVFDNGTEKTVNFKQLSKAKRVHPTEKPEGFSWMLKQVVSSSIPPREKKNKSPVERYVLDPFCGSGRLLEAFPNSVGVDIENYGNFPVGKASAKANARK